MRIVFHMTKIVFYFTIGSSVIIFLFSFVVHTMSINYDSPYNKFENVYIGMLILYEFIFGAVEYIRRETPTTENIIMNIFLIFFSFIGNIMIANILIGYLTNRFEAIYKESSYWTKKMQFY